MKIDHVHFYTQDAVKTSNWFIRNIGFQAIAKQNNSQHGDWLWSVNPTIPRRQTKTEVIANNSVFFVISSPLNSSSPVADYLNSHPTGVADIAFRVQNIDSIIANAIDCGVHILQSPQIYQSKRGKIKWAKIQGWDSLQHTLIENTTLYSGCCFVPDLEQNSMFIADSSSASDMKIIGIDHLVLNVPADELQRAVALYQTLFSFQIRQTFNIQTKRSGLSSQALIDSTGKVQFNINQPTSADSQIQDFIDLNHGSGIQHIALRTHNIFQTVAKMRSRSSPRSASLGARSRSVSFLSVPPTYYHQLKRRYQIDSIPSLTWQEWEAIQTEQILVDWNRTQPRSLLLQIFTQPIFEQPTFFLELIERREQAQGFGEGNFQALFEAVEQEQLKRL